jgi:DNA-binding CsgD family transcriptional regulator
LKYLALDLGCASSTVSAELKHVIASMGLGARVAELPLLVAQLRCAVRARSGIDARCATFRLGGEEHLILAMERVETQWLAQLSRAEAEVLALLLKGYSYAGIGASRDASSRTIANQVASIFRKFGVSGRLELLATIARGRAASHRFS